MPTELPDPSPFPVDDFLKRLGLSGAPSADENGLLQLHRAHCLSIPFENLDPFLARPVPLDLPSLCGKVLEKRRGGYCFELNSLFLAALEAFGFRARPVLGRVFMGRPKGGPRTHQASLVEIKGRTWLADVGFGGPGLVEPIPFEAGFEGEQGGRKIRLRHDSEWGMRLEDELEGSWRTLYALPEEKVIPVDMIAGNHYCATHPDSIFRNNLFCALPTEEGRITVWDRSLMMHSSRGKEEKILKGPEELKHLFRDLLQLPVTEQEIEALHQRLPALQS